MRHPGLYVVLLGLVLLAVALIPPWLQRQPPTQLLGEFHSQCQSGTNCSVTLPDIGLVQLLILPAKLPHNEPLKVSLKTHSSVQSATLQFIGRDMYMGIMPVDLQPLNDRNFQTTTRISYCTIDTEMHWLAEIRLTTNAGTYQITFELDPTS